MKTSTARLAAGLSLSGMLGMAGAAAADTYVWGNVPIGGGGAIPSITVHPKVPGLAYITTDVGGAYRWEEAVGRWEPVLDWLRAADEKLIAVESLAIDPNDATGDFVVIIAGADAWSPTVKGEIMTSTDRGRTWRRTGHRVAAASNWTQTTAQRLTVDPRNGRVIYHASREGLFRSLDRGATWALVKTAPTGSLTPHKNKSVSGAACIVGDPASGTVGDPPRTKTLYLSVDGTPSWHRSDDGGETWQVMEGAPGTARQARVTSDGALIVSTGKGLFRHTDGWAEISPVKGSGCCAIAIDPTDERRMATSRFLYGFWNLIYRTTDGGATWREVKDEHAFDAKWYPGSHVRASVFSIAFDPFDPKRAWYTDWYQPWRTEDFWAEKVAWASKVRGVEETCTTGCLSCPPVGDVLLVSGVADDDGFVHTSLTEFPAKKIPLGLTITGADFQESDPAFIVVTGTDHWDRPGGGGFSTDGGKTFTKFAKLPRSDVRGGRVAVSATNDHIVWATGGFGVYWSHDRGKTWTEGKGCPPKSGIGGWIFTAHQPFASDRVQGDTFYLHSGDKLYRSTDGGVTWAPTRAGLPSDWDSRLVTSPAAAGELWLSVFGKGNHGVWRSTDFGDTFTRVDGIDRASLLACGVGRTPGTAALYVYGVVRKQDGIFRSDDNGATWTRIDIATPFPGKGAGAMAADRRVYGRVFVATGGRGIYCGQIAPADGE